MYTWMYFVIRALSGCNVLLKPYMGLLCKVNLTWVYFVTRSIRYQTILQYLEILVMDKKKTSGLNTDVDDKHLDTSDDP